MRSAMAVLLALTILLAGCGRPAASPGEGASAAVPTMDHWRDLTVKLRSKAGVYLDEKEGMILITLFEPHFRADAERAVASVEGLSPRAVVIREVQYDWGDLGRWEQELNRYFSEVNGITSWDVDHRVNRLWYSVTTVEAKERLEAPIRKAGVPRDAVIIDLPDGALSEKNPLKGCQLQKPAERPEEKPSRYSLAINSAVLRPGQEFTLKAEGAKEHELTRGVDAYLECWDGKSWTPRYLLYSEGPKALLYSPNRAIESVGYEASRPGRFVLPSDLKPGWYRIRMDVYANGPDRLWTLVEIKR